MSKALHPSTASDPAPAAPSDNELLDRIGQKDATAMSLLYERYAGLLYGIVVKIAPTIEEANDLLQDIFLQIWTRAPGYQPDKGKAIAWLCSIARNRGIDAHRRNAHRRDKKETYTHYEEQRRPGIRREEDPWEKLVMVENTAAVREALESLPGAQKELMYIALYQGLTHQEIATQQNIPLGTVKSRMRQAMQQLSRCFQPETSPDAK